MNEGDDQVTVGVVGKPVGLRGEVYVRPDVDLPDEVFSAGRTVGVRPPSTEHGSGPQPSGTLRIAAARLHAGRRVVRFDGVDTRERAEELRASVLTVARADIPLDEGSFWSSDLLGRDVVDVTGAMIGVLEAVADGTAHDYLVVARPDGGELLIPAVAELITIGAEEIVVEPVPGLLDPED